MFRQDPSSEPARDQDDDLLCAKEFGRESIEYQTEDKRSRLGWGITHI